MIVLRSQYRAILTPANTINGIAQNNNEKVNAGITAFTKLSSYIYHEAGKLANAIHVITIENTVHAIKNIFIVTPFKVTNYSIKIRICQC